jgi:hypothetical protein
VTILRGGAAGAALLAAILILSRSDEPTCPVSESEGRIDSIYLQFTRRTSAITAPIYRELLRSIEGRVYVGCPAAEDWEEFRRLVGSGERFRPIFTGRKTSAWAKDRFVPVRVGRVLHLLVPDRPPAAAAGDPDWRVAWDVARAIGGVVRPLPIDFDGGDIWMTRDLAFAGRELLPRNPTWTEEKLRALLARELGVPVLFVEGAPHHLGMFMTPLDSKTVVVADPGPPTAGEPSWLGRLRTLPSALREAGIRTIAIPFEPTRDDLVYVTYNNVVIDGRAVFMPVYGRPTDGAARAVWESEGYSVHPIPAHRIYVHRGVLHCMVNVLSRAD